MIKYIFLVIMFLCSSATSVSAAELFGVKLISATKSTLRQAANMAGARLKRQAGEFDFYDEYYSADILKNSDKLFFGFSKKTEKFAFAEYEFKGLRQDEMLRRLVNKYGPSQKLKQVFISDTIHRWVIDGVEISYYKDWANYKTRVTYIVPELLAELKIAKKRVGAAIARGKLNKQTNVF